MINQLMANPAANAAYGSINAGADLDALADLFERLITHNDRQSAAVSLGIEIHVRQMAQIHFHRAEVNRALSRIERALEGKDSSRGRRRKRSTARARLLA